MPEIRKIVVGPDFKNGMAYSVGQELIRDNDEESPTHGKKKEKIVRISKKDNRYEIWFMTTNGSREVKLWRHFENMPISVEYNINY